LQNVTIAARKLLGAINGLVCAFAHPIGVTVEDKTALEERLYQVADGMVHHPVAEGGS